EFPEDTAPFGINRPPVLEGDIASIGLKPKAGRIISTESRDPVIPRGSSDTNTVIKGTLSDLGRAIPTEVLSPRVLTNQPHMKLKFTGTCDPREFRARCKEQDYWYHSYYFDNCFTQRGDYDIGHDVAGYGFPQNLEGMSVLDVGTGSGWFATF